MKALIHIDVDGSWVIKRHLGYPVESGDDNDILIQDGLPKILEILYKTETLATFFVIGSDLESSSRRKLLQETVSAGHQVGNHSYQHQEGFYYLSPGQKKADIIACHQAIKQHLEVEPIIFRAPNFELDYETLAILNELGYRYDSSILPSAAILPLKLFHYLRCKSQTRSMYLGELGNALAARYPYHPGKACIRGNSEEYLDIIELPVAVSPCFRLPVHLSYLRLYYRLGLWRRMLLSALRWYKKKGYPFVFLVHLSDLATRNREPQISSEPGNSLDDRERQSLFKDSLDLIRQYFEIVPTSIIGSYMNL